MAMDKSLISVLLLLDFSKAFEWVAHDILHSKLKYQFHFDDTDYLLEWLQTVCVDGEFSGYLLLIKDVSAGTIVGPLLFSLFMNDSVSWHTKSSQMISKYTVRSSLVTRLKKINSDLSATNTQGIAIRSSSETRILPPVRLRCIQNVWKTWKWFWAKRWTEKITLKPSAIKSTQDYGAGGTILRSS